MRVKYSFIIPAYHAEATITECVHSIVIDILDCFERTDCVEILIVENGSGQSRCKNNKEWCYHNDVNIRILKSEKGVSKARNLGLRESEGEYIIFVDSDDIWLKGSLKKIETDIQSNADLLVYSFMKGRREQTDKQCDFIQHPDFVNESFATADEYKAWMICRPTLRMQIWGKVFCGNIIRKQSIFFNENLAFSEDSEFIIRYLLCCKKIVVLGTPIYKYILNPNSVMHQRSEVRVQDYIKSLLSSLEVIEKQQNKTIKSAFLEYILIHLNIILVHDVWLYCPKKTKPETNLKMRYIYMMKILQIPLFKNTIRDISYVKCMSFQLIPELMFKMHLYIFGGGMTYVRSWLNYRKAKDNSK